MSLPPTLAPALGPEGLRAAYLMARANLFHEDKVCDLADELHSLCPEIFVSPETIKAELGAKYHAALDKNAKARRLLARTVLSSWTLHPAPGSMVHTPAKDIWELGDFEMVIIVRNVSPAGFISDKVMLAERVPYHPNESQRVIYWTERSVGGGQQLFFHREQIKIADFSDEPRPAWRGNQRFLFVLMLGKPTSPSPPSRHSGYDEAFLYSGHQTAFFLSGAPPSCALELAGLVYLDFADQRIARKKICLPARLPNQCPVCLEDDTVFVVYAFCGRQRLSRLHGEGVCSRQGSPARWASVLRMSCPVPAGLSICLPRTGASVAQLFAGPPAHPTQARQVRPIARGEGLPGAWNHGPDKLSRYLESRHSRR